MARIAVIAGTDAGYRLADVLAAAGHELARQPSLSPVIEGAEVFFVESWLYMPSVIPADVPVVIIAPPDALWAAVQVVERQEAYDLLRVPSSADEMRLMASRALRHRQILRENRSLRQEMEIRRRAVVHAPAMPGPVPGLARSAPADRLNDVARDLAGQPLAAIEKQVILSTLKQFKGHRLKTASALGIGVRTLGMKIKRWRDQGEQIDVRSRRHAMAS